jgi:transcriptional regulator with XRE-family HTH domain
MTDNARFRDELRRLKQQRGLSYRALASRSNYSSSYLQELVKGDKPPNEAIAEQLDMALDAGGRLVALLRPVSDGTDDEIEAAELTRRVTTSDVSPETLDQLERAADRLSVAYSTTPPVILLPRIRRLARLRPRQRRLLVVGGWLSLLRATLHIDLRRAGAAGAYLRTAALTLHLVLCQAVPRQAARSHGAEGRQAKGVTAAPVTVA